MPLRYLYGINRSCTAMVAVVPSLIAVAPRKTVNIADLRGGTAETLNMYKTSAVLPRVGPMSGSPRHRHYRRDTAMTAVAPYKDRSGTSITAVHPQTIAVQSRKSRRDPMAISWRFYCGYGGATTVLPPHWPRGAATNTAVMPPMIAVAPPSKRSCKSMGSQRKTMKNYWRCHCGDGGFDQKP